MNGDGVRETKRILYAYLAISIALLAILGVSLTQAMVTHHRVGPAQVHLQPGERIEIPLEARMNVNAITLRLEMVCSEELDVVVLHGSWSPGDDYHSAINLTEASTVLSTGTWNERLEDLCDCGRLLVIDNTEGGSTPATPDPVQVRYTLDWNEHTSFTWLPQFYAIIAIAVMIPIVLVLLFMKMETDARPM